MLRRIRAQKASALLVLVALLGQVLLPMAQARMLSAGGGALTYAYCGSFSPTFAARLAQAQPKAAQSVEALQRTRSTGHAIDSLGCALCLAADGAQHGATTFKTFAVLPVPAQAPARFIGHALLQLQRVVLPPLRAPPAGL